MSIFKKDWSDLSKKSGKALSLFTEALDSLRKVNEEALIREQKLTSEIQEREEEIKQLSSISKTNISIIKNIEKIIS